MLRLIEAFWCDFGTPGRAHHDSTVSQDVLGSTVSQDDSTVSQDVLDHDSTVSQDVLDCLIDCCILFSHILTRSYHSALQLR